MIEKINRDQLKGIDLRIYLDENEVTEEDLEEMAYEISRGSRMISGWKYTNGVYFFYGPLFEMELSPSELIDHFR